MTTARPPAVAGSFYPADPIELRREVERHLAAARADPGPCPKAVVVPHAGYRYSGPVAGSAYATLRAGEVERVVLLGPAHHYPVRGLATIDAEAFVTPLGRVAVERSHLPVLDVAHENEHSLEVQLPFLQVVLGEFRIVPAVVGEITGEEVATELERLWGGSETLVVVSSDLSHYHDHATAKRLDGRTADAITALRAELVGPDEACGCRAIQGLLLVGRRRRLCVRALDVRNSGDVAGLRDRVVGYGAFALWESAREGGTVRA